LLRNGSSFSKDLVEKVQADIFANEMSQVLGGKGGRRANFQIKMVQIQKIY